jgi:hypothetical protein
MLKLALVTIRPPGEAEGGLRAFDSSGKDAIG